MQTKKDRQKKASHRVASQQSSAKQTPVGRRSRTIAAATAQIAANEYCLLHYGTSYVGGIPRQLCLPTVNLWIVPVVLTSPGYGVVGEVGMVAVDRMSGGVVGATPRPEVRAAGTQLAQENRHELDTAFRRARTV
jgi:hypothetical protein